MIKKLCILLLLVYPFASLLAQKDNNNEDNHASFAPKKGQWQISIVLGNGTFYNEDNMDRLLPDYGSAQIGFGETSKNQSADPGIFLNLGSLNNNSLVNICGMQGKYFLTDRWDVNLTFSMNINLTPKKDFTEGEYTNPYQPSDNITDMNIPAYQYLEGRMTNQWMTSVGSNYYFKTRNGHINPYVGGIFGFQMGRIETNRPYTGVKVANPDVTPPADSEDGINDPQYQEPIEMYFPSSRAGQLYGFHVAAVAGIEYSFSKGLLLGFEAQPLSYRYNVLEICPKGLPRYSAKQHNIKIFAMPVVKLGMRF